MATIMTGIQLKHGLQLKNNIRKRGKVMALIKCPECGKDISDSAETCPNCGFLVWKRPESANIEKLSSVSEINGVQFDIENIKQKAIIKTVANVSKKIKKLCQCNIEEAESVVYRYFLSAHGENTENLKEKIKHIKSWNGKKLYCPYCLSRNININETISESVSKGHSEIKKKSVATRAGNKAGRASMIMATGGLWALTPKKSDYKETNKGKTTYHTTTTKTCMDCGMKLL